MRINGTYYQFFRYYFAGNHGTVIGDLASDIVYWNGQTGHQNDIYHFTYQTTGVSSSYIWEYGYKVVDNSARVIKASKSLQESLSCEDLQELNIYTAEAYALRAYSNFVMANVFCHQVKVDGKDFSNNLGLVVVDEPVEAFSEYPSLVQVASVEILREGDEADVEIAYPYIKGILVVDTVGLAA
ncbi:MAG: RagB/SusD family nutrient uptake outer membrane protein [Muribaculaceae bacterium]|nr:RagB/SusD family nutrient uptake outer membrane protein [Muribaculaceae bacterium]